jgi:hypothetical protein
MKPINTIIIATILAFAAGFIGHKASAEEYGNVIAVQKNFGYVTEYVPHQECRKAADPGSVLLGIILGGVSGKVITGEDGGAAIGAIAGGMIASDDKSNLVCTTVHQKVKKHIVHSYDITYEWNGFIGSARTYYPLLVGDLVVVRVSLDLL